MIFYQLEEIGGNVPKNPGIHVPPSIPMPQIPPPPSRPPPPIPQTSFVSKETNQQPPSPIQESRDSPPPTYQDAELTNDGDPTDYLVPSPQQYEPSTSAPPPPSPLHPPPPPPPPPPSPPHFPPHAIFPTPSAAPSFPCACDGVEWVYVLFAGGTGRYA